MNRCLAIAAFFLLPLASLTAGEGFKWTDTPGKHVDLTYDGRTIVRYMYEALDESTPERREETYKPFHHVFDAAGEKPITKGPGGKYTHHRGIYYGFSKCSYTDAEGKEHTGIDTWHCRKPHQSHQNFRKHEADAVSAFQCVEIHWHDNEGKVFVKEVRELTFSRADDGALVVDFESTTKPTVPKVKFDGDPQHAGFQFRASHEVFEKTAKQTYYIRPKTGKAEPGATINWSAKTDSEATRDLPWKGLSFVVNGDERYTPVYLDHPDNPKPARYSERDSGRFGSYFVAELTPEKPLTVNYRLNIKKGERTPDECAALSEAFLK